MLGTSQLIVTSERTVTDSELTKLSPIALELLQILAGRPGEIVERTELVDRLWRGNWLIGDPALSRVISEIRSTLGDDPKRPSLIQTVPRRGYRLLQPAENLHLGMATSSRELRGPQLFRVFLVTIIVLTLCLAILGLVATAARYFR